MSDHAAPHAAGPGRGSFWVGVERVTGAHGTVPRGQMYVEWESPAELRHEVPLILIHGGGGQGTDYLRTPDGRPGWAPLLVEQGYAVYVVDRPGHGRSPHHPDVLGPIGPAFGYEFCIDLFAPARGAHPTSHLHTQWPGGREIGDPVIDQLLAATGPTLADWSQMHALEQTRMVELLDRIGPAVVVAHSAGGPAGFLAADARPELVRALVAIEVVGPPFLERPDHGIHLDWGLASAPLTYDPPAATAADLQREPARRLPNLARVPIAVVTAEASIFAQFDGELLDFLQQASCDAELVRLADHGVHGNGHGMMFEANHADALGVITAWLDQRVTTTPAARRPQPA